MIFAIAGGGFLISCLLLFFGRKAALRAGLSDKPGGRKTHDEATPLIGGIIVIPVFVLSLFMAGVAAEYWVLIVAALTLMLMGLIDDAIHINAWLKFAVQVLVACFVVVFGQIDIILLGNLYGFGEVELWATSKPFSVMCLVLFMNAFNMIDGLDGLSGGFAAVALGVLISACALAGAPEVAGVLACVLAPVLAFLIFNMRYLGHAKASVFMGDAGTLAMGLILGWFVIELTQEPLLIMAPAVAPWIVGIPVIDALAVYLVRALNGENPFMADRNHIHHRLVDNSVPHDRASYVIVGFSFVVAISALLLSHSGVADSVLFYCWLVFCGFHMALVFRPQRYASLLKRFA